MGSELGGEGVDRLKGPMSAKNALSNAYSAANRGDREGAKNWIDKAMDRIDQAYEELDVEEDEGIDMADFGVASLGGLVCQNFEEHDEEVKMTDGPYDGVMCPECGRMAGGSEPLDIPYVDQEEQ